MLKFPRTCLALSISTALCAVNVRADTSVQENSSQDQGSPIQKRGAQQQVSSDVRTSEPEVNPTQPIELSALLWAAELQPVDLTAQCLVPETKEEQDAHPTYIEADSLEGQSGEQATYRGEVKIVQGNRRVNAEAVTLRQQENTIIAEGNVTMTDGQIKTTADKATSNLDTDITILEKADYQLLCQPGRGDAEVIRLEGKVYYELEDGSITSCPDGDNTWRLRASSIEVDQTEEQAVLYNPRFEVQNVPVFYLPWLTIPTGNTRKTGFLYPTAAYGTQDGIELEVPFYWNLAPNYDLTTTAKYMEKRGVQLDGTFRYLTDFGYGTIEGQYLADDDEYPELGDRWGIGYTHYGVFDRNWKVEVDYAKVSDIFYFRDISSGIGEREDGQLLQQGKVSYRNEHWDTSLLVRDFQLLYEDNGDLPYEMMPQLNANYFYPGVTSFLDFDVISHITHFKTDDNNKPEAATRLHIEPGVTIPVNLTWFSWETEARLLGTFYDQKLDNLDVTGSLEENVTRVIPEFRSHATLFLERDTTIYEGYTQTLEPRVQYLYVPEEDQDDIYNYDTTLLQTDYYGLFRTRKFSGVDKIVAANQISYGATSRFYDQDYRERLNISFGQIYYIKDNEANRGVDQEDSNYSAWAVEADFNFNDQIFYHGGIQYDTSNDDIQLANSTLEYRDGPGYIQANYRYVSKEYIDETLKNTDGTPANTFGLTNDGISQIGGLGGYKFNHNWSVNGQYFYDTTEHMMVEALARVTYTSDCWYIGITYTDQLRSYQNLSTTPNDPGPEYEDNISLNVGIIGFGTNFGTSTGDGGNALGYGRPFYLNN